MQAIRMTSRSLVGVAVVVAALAAAGCRKRVNAMEYCKALEFRGIASDCAAPSPVEPEATFRVKGASADGTVFAGPDDYDAQRILELEKKMRNDKRCRYWIGKDHMFVQLCGDVDIGTKADLARFFASSDGESDQMAIVKGRPLAPRTASERPVKSSSCSECYSTGFCSVYPSKPGNCLAGFDSDCGLSKLCRGGEESSDSLCYAQSAFGLCGRDRLGQELSNLPKAK